MTRYIYEEIMEGINNGEITFIRFCVNDYAHYKNCVIARTELKLPNGKSIPQIEVTLTKDLEKTTFLEEFIENTKLFRMGSKGNFTLKQIWPQITILEIVDSNLSRTIKKQA